MRKTLFFLALILSIFCTAQAGYVIRGITTLVDPVPLRNYTLAFDKNGEPIAAASMIHPYTGTHSIAIVQVNRVSAFLFPVMINNENLPIEVRDFHYVNYSDTYILCGSRGASAFVATINGTFSSMRYMEYPEASIFYSFGENALLQFPPYPIFTFAAKKMTMVLFVALLLL